MPKLHESQANHGGALFWGAAFRQFWPKVIKAWLHIRFEAAWTWESESRGPTSTLHLMGRRVIVLGGCKMPKLHEAQANHGGASFFGIEMSFLWYRGGPSLLFGIEISFLVSRFGILLFSI